MNSHWALHYGSGVLIGLLLLFGVVLYFGDEGVPTGYVIYEADLTSYPEPYSIGGQMRGVIVVGAQAGASDALGAERLARSLQYRQDPIIERPSGIAKSSELELSGETFLIRTNADYLEGSEALSDVIDIIGEDEISLLADAEILTQDGIFSYQQFLSMSPGATTTFEVADDIPDDKEKIPELYLKFAQDTMAYTYILEFTDPMVLKSASSSNSYRLSGLEGKTFPMLGEKMFVLNAKHPNADGVDLTLLGGNLLSHLNEGEYKEYTIDDRVYGVELILVDENEQALIAVNGDVQKPLSEGETTRIDGFVELGVTDILVNSMGGFVEFLFDAQKYELTDLDITSQSTENTFEINGESIQGSNVQIYGSDEGLSEGSEVTITKIEVSWLPSDDYFIKDGGRLSDLLEDEDALFTGNWDIIFNGFVTKDSSETITLEPHGNDEYVLTFENVQGEELEIPLFYDDQAGDGFERFGDDTYTLIVDEGDSIAVDDYFLVTSDGYRGRFTAREETWLLRYEDNEVEDSYLVLRNMATDELINAPYTSAISTFSIGHDEYTFNISNTSDKSSSITVDLDNDGTITSGDVPMLVTRTRSTISLDATSYENFTYTTKEMEEGATLSVWSPYGTENSVDSFRVNIEDDTGIDVASVERCLGANYEEMAAVLGAPTAGAVMDSCFSTFSNAPYPIWVDVGETNRKQTFVNFGHLLELEEDYNGPDSFSMIAPEDPLEFLVYVTDRRTKLIEEEVAQSSRRYQQIEPGSIRLDVEEPRAPYQIVIGGPCSNALSAELLPNTDCWYGFEEDRAIIKPIEKDGVQYVLVAGYDGADTAAAIYVLEHYDEFNLHASGTEVINDGEILTKPLVDWESRFVQGEVAVVEEPKEVEVVICEHPLETEGSYETKSKKLGLGETHTTKVIVDGKEKKITLIGDEPFNARFGINFWKGKFRVLKSTCHGEEISAVEFTQNDGDQILIEKFNVDPGCYCLMLNPDDMYLDSANIYFTSIDKFSIPFKVE